MPAGGRYLPFLVEPENMLHANSVLDATAGTISLVGPAPAAIIVKIGCITLVGFTLVAVGMLQKLWLICGLLLIIGSVSGMLNLHVIAWIQQRVKPAFRGWVMSQAIRR
jgi:hypothetical protein